MAVEELPSLKGLLEPEQSSSMTPLLSIIITGSCCCDGGGAANIEATAGALFPAVAPSIIIIIIALALLLLGCGEAGFEVAVVDEDVEVEEEEEGRPRPSKTAPRAFMMAATEKPLPWSRCTAWKSSADTPRSSGSFCICSSANARASSCIARFSASSCLNLRASSAVLSFRACSCCSNSCSRSFFRSRKFCAAWRLLAIFAARRSFTDRPLKSWRFLRFIFIWLLLLFPPNASDCELILFACTGERGMGRRDWFAFERLLLFCFVCLNVASFFQKKKRVKRK